MAREETKPVAPPSPAARPAGDPEKDALKARVEELERQLAAKPAPAAAMHGAESPGRRRGPTKLRLWRVSLDNVIKGFTTPSPYFAAEFPGDPRGEPIQAYDEVEARAIFRRIHAIEGGPNPECVELSPVEAEAAKQLPPEALAKKKAAKERKPAVAGRPAVAARTEEQEREAADNLARAAMA